MIDESDWAGFPEVAEDIIEAALWPVLEEVMPIFIWFPFEDLSYGPDEGLSDQL